MVDPSTGCYGMRHTFATPFSRKEIRLDNNNGLEFNRYYGIIPPV